ncbi:hypothetical protein F4680DRAFT_429803 [Xylaria scruposa]|nr:hypothetical protein F4680DRAFT_429803 [Xylaria scruposa]
MFRWLPTIDAAPIFRNRSTSASIVRSAFAAQLVAHLGRDGFARVHNHGVMLSTVEDLFNYHRHFFNLPLSSKLSVRHAGGECPARGYSPWAYEKTAILRPDLHNAPNLSIGDVALSDSLHKPRSRNSYSSTRTSERLLDAREQFAMGSPCDTQYPTPQLDENLLPGFTTAIAEAYGQIINTCKELVDLIEVGLGAPQSSISSLAPSVSPEAALAAGGGADAVRALLPPNSPELHRLLLAYSRSINAVFYLLVAVAVVCFVAGWGTG